MEVLDWGQTCGKFLKESACSVYVYIIYKTANVNKSIKLNARHMLRKCHRVFTMGLLSGGVETAACATCLERHKAYRGMCEVVNRQKDGSSGGDVSSYRWSN